MTPHLVLRLDGTRYALPVNAVRAVFRLPELSPVEDLPAHFVGLVDYHGEIAPVTDLGRRFGRRARAPHDSQSVVLLEGGPQRLGLLADEAIGVLDVAPGCVEPYAILEEDPATPLEPVIAGAIRREDGVLLLLDAARLLHEVRDPATPRPTPDDAAVPAAEQHPALARRRARARALAEPVASNEAPGEPFVFVRIEEADFAVALEDVAGFARLEDWTPLPSCPSHVLGCMNLRGTILPLVDVAPVVLGRPQSAPKHVLVVSTGDTTIGCVVSAVLDLDAIPLEALQPSAAGGHGAAHCRRLAHLSTGTAAVLDVRALLGEGLLEVNDHA